MTHLEPVLDAAAVERLIRDGLPGADQAAIHVETIGPAMARVRVPYDDNMLRPGGIVSGPTLFTAADTAMYAVVLAHAGAELMAVTADTQIRFLRAAVPGDVIAEATIRHFGRRTIVCDVSIWTEGDMPVAIASGTYARP